MAEPINMKMNVDVQGIPEPRELDLKAGWKTTEFWIALVMQAVGVWLISRDKDDLGFMLCSMSGLGYHGSRTLVKRGLTVPGKAVVNAALLLCVLFLPGCSAGYVRADAVWPTLEPVLQRHDDYLLDDPELSELEKRIQLRSTELQRKTFRTALGLEPEQPQ